MKRATVHKIKLLKNIKPRPEWAASTRDILFSQINAQSSSPVVAHQYSLQEAVVYATSYAQTAFRLTLGTLLSGPRNASLSLGVLTGMALVAVVAASSSLPGEPLYNVKLTTETIQSTFVTPDQRAQLEVERADKRLEEIKQILATKQSDDEKGEKLAGLVDNLSERISNVKSSLDSPAAGIEPKKAANVAVLVHQKTGAYETALGGEQLNNLSAEKQKALDKKFDHALATTDAAQRTALQVIVDKKDSAGIPESEVVSHLTQRLVQTQEELAKLSDRVSAAAISHKADTMLQEKSDHAKKILGEAEFSLGRKDFKVALEKLNQSKDLMQEIARSMPHNTLKDAQEHPRDGVGGAGQKNNGSDAQ